MNSEDDFVPMLACCRQARVLGNKLLKKLSVAIASDTAQDSWLWGDKENAVSLYVKLTGSLVKVLEQENRLLDKQSVKRQVVSWQTDMPGMTPAEIQKEDEMILEQYKQEILDGILVDESI